MAEIKSAIEIAMEKTKGLRLSSEERGRLREEEFQSRAHALVNRFLEVDFHFREVERELAKYPPDQQGRLRDLMRKDLVDSLRLDRNNDLIYQGIEILRKEQSKTIRKVQELVRRYQEKKESEYRKAERALQVKLAHLGISGSAVLPRVEGSREWEKALAAFRPDYDDQLQALKEEINRA